MIHICQVDSRIISQIPAKENKCSITDMTCVHHHPLRLLSKLLSEHHSRTQKRPSRWKVYPGFTSGSVVPGVGIEPTCPCGRRILSPASAACSHIGLPAS